MFSPPGWVKKELWVVGLLVLKIMGLITVVAGVWTYAMKMWKWFWTRYDSPVLDVLELRTHPKHYGRGFRIDEITQQIKRSEASIRGSLNRLKRSKKAICTQDGWYALLELLAS